VPMRKVPPGSAMVGGAKLPVLGTVVGWGFEEVSWLADGAQHEGDLPFALLCWWGSLMEMLLYKPRAFETASVEKRVSPLLRQMRRIRSK